MVPNFLGHPVIVTYDFFALKTERVVQYHHATPPPCPMRRGNDHGSWVMDHVGHGSTVWWVTWVMGHERWPISISASTGLRLLSAWSQLWNVCEQNFYLVLCMLIPFSHSCITILQQYVGTLKFTEWNLHTTRKCRTCGSSLDNDGALNGWPRTNRMHQECRWDMSLTLRPLYADNAPRTRAAIYDIYLVGYNQLGAGLFVRSFVCLSVCLIFPLLFFHYVCCLLRLMLNNDV